MNFNQLDAFLNRGILILKPSLKVKYWNNWLENKTGISAAEITDRQIHDFFQIEPSVRKTIDRCFQYGQPQILSYIFHEYFIPIKVNHPNQMFMYQSAQITPMITNNEVESVLIVIDDVSESILYERELKISNTELKASNQQLAASEQQLSASNQQLCAIEEELRATNDELIAANANLEKLNRDLKKSEVRLIDAQRIARIGNWELNITTQEVLMSDEMFKIIGLPNNASSTNVANHEKYYTPESWKRFTEKIDSTIKTGEPYELEMEFSDPKNPCRYAVVRGEAIYDERHNIVALKGTLQDITEQKKNETEIRKQRDFIQMLMDNSPIGVATNKMDTQKVTYINDKFAEIYGWEKEEFPYTVDFFEKVFPDAEYRENVQEKIVADISSGKPERMCWDDLVITTQSGEKRVVVAINIPLPEQNTMISTVQDITQRKKDEKEIIEAKEKAEEEELKYRQLYESNLMPISIFDTETLKFLSVNQAFTEKYGYSREELLKMTILDIRPETELEKLLQNVNIEEKGLENKGIYLHQKKNGEIMHVEIIRYSLLFEGRDAKLVFSNDVSKLMKSQAELIKAKEKAEESDKLKSAFLANMSHEIRTPMNGILGFSSLLDDDSYTEQQRKEYRKIIQNNGENLLKLIDDIIDISKLDSEQLKLSTAPTKLFGLLQQAHQNFIQIIHRKNISNITIKLELPQNFEEVEIDIDQTRLTQVINNLLNNAIKFTDKGEIKLKCKIIGSVLRFSVKDEGVGIASSKQKTIFERFNQVNYNITNNKGGAGLGLAISKGIIEAFKGKIWVESQLGMGSTFYFEIPFEPLKIKSKQEKETTSTPKDLSEKTILIVDDEETIRLYLSTVLAQLKVQILEACNGKEAIEVFKQHKNIDLILMDLRMPEMNGFDSLAAIRKLNTYTKVIAQTAYAMPGEREKCLQAGFSDYIEKPIKKEKLFSKIHKWI